MNTFVPFSDIKQSVICLDYLRLNKQIIEVQGLLVSARQGPVVLAAIDPRSKLPQTTGKRIRYPKTYLYGPVPKVYDGDQHRLESTPWYNHPARKMWHGYELALWAYGLHCCLEHTLRHDRAHTSYSWLIQFYAQYHEWFGARIGHKSLSGLSMSEIMASELSDLINMPPWWGNEEVHSSHRANLLRKDREHYGQFGWTEEPREGYVWPSTEVPDDEAWVQ